MKKRVFLNNTIVLSIFDKTLRHLLIHEENFPHIKLFGNQMSYFIGKSSLIFFNSVPIPYCTMCSA